MVNYDIERELGRELLNVALHLGRGNPKKIVLVHGFTQAGLVWKSLAEDLADAGYEVMAPDLPGHGETDPKYDQVDLWEAGRLLGETCGEAIYVGYSLGGRTLLHTALHPELDDSLMRAMVLIGAKAGYKDRDNAQKRVQEDNALADRIEELGQQRLDEFIDEWLKHPVNIRLPLEATHRELRLRNRAIGVASSLRHCGSGVQVSLWDKVGQLDMPVLVAFAEFDTPPILEDNRGLAEAIGDNAHQLEFKGVGHSIPFEAPEAFGEVVKNFASDH